jgi:hypothetical protein
MIAERKAPYCENNTKWEAAASDSLFCVMEVKKIGSQVAIPVSANYLEYMCFFLRFMNKNVQ